MADSYIWFVIVHNLHFVLYYIQHILLFFEILFSNINNMKFLVVFSLLVLLLTRVEIDFVMRFFYIYFSHNESLNMTDIYNDINTHIYILSSTSSAEVLETKNYQIEYIPVRNLDHKEYSYRFIVLTYRVGKQEKKYTETIYRNVKSHNLLQNTPRYVEFRLGVGGLANKMFGLVSSIVIAALLNATLICLTLYLFC